MAINLQSLSLMNTPYTTEADQLISDIQSFQMPEIPQQPVQVPSFTGYGNRMAMLGGFTEIKTPEELEKMTQAEIDAYVKERKSARRQGVAETLMRVGEAFQGKPASQLALQREQARRNAEIQKQYQAEYNATIELAEKSGKLGEARLLRSLGLPGYINLQQKRAEQMLTSDGELFKGQGVVNQFYNVLLQGQQDESVRQSPMYKTAFDYLSQPKTETYINEFGQQVTRTIPGMISKEDYLPPIGVVAVDKKPVVTEPKEEEIVKVSPERRKTLQTQIDTVDNSERKILAFQKKLDEIKPNPLTRGEDRADIQSSYTSLLLELKNLEQLGVLAGPDLDLLQSMVGDPTGFQQFFIAGGTAGINKQLNNLLQSIRDRKTPIYKELGMKEPKGTITQTTQKYYMPGGREIKVNATGDGWIYADTGEAVTQ